jgi:hypothetical protein
MSRSTRIAIVVGAVVLAVAAFVVLQPDSQEGSDGTSAAGATTETPVATTPATTTTPGAPAPAPEPKPDPGPLLTAGEVTELRVKQGETVRFRVRADTSEEVHVHGYDTTYELQPGRTRAVAFKADLQGIWEIELENAATQIAELRVDP